MQAITKGKQIAIVIPVHNRRETTLECIRSLNRIKDTNTYNATIIVVDDGSTDGTAEAIRGLGYDDLVILHGDGNLWWTGGINRGISYALDSGKFDYVLIMNDDNSFDDDFIQHLLCSAVKNDRALFGSITLFANDRQVIWKAGMTCTGKPYPLLVDNFHRTKYSIDLLSELIEVDAISGRSLLMPITVFDEIGLFDNDRFPHGFADHDFCYRAKEVGFSLLLNTRSLTYSDPGADKSFFHLLSKAAANDFWKTFSDIKYDWNLKILFGLYIRSRGWLRGSYGFVRHVMALSKWILLKYILADKIFQRIIAYKLID